MPLLCIKLSRICDRVAGLSRTERLSKTLLSFYKPRCVQGPPAAAGQRWPACSYAACGFVAGSKSTCSDPTQAPGRQPLEFLTACLQGLISCDVGEGKPEADMSAVSLVLRQAEEASAGDAMSTHVQARCADFCST